MRSNMFLYYFILSLFVISYAESNFTSDCGKKEKIASYLDMACEMISKAKLDMSSLLDIEKNVKNDSKTPVDPVDCSDILRMGQNRSGVYTILPMSRLIKDKLNVYCDMDTDGGGWTVIQRRGNYGNPNDYFYNDWQSYKKGFGNIDEDFWFGNDNIFALTNQRLYSVRFDLQDVKLKKAYALYDSFWIDAEVNNYTLHANGFNGDAGDSLKFHNELQFATKDVDDDARSSHAKNSRGGWWYGGSKFANLNGLYIRGESSPQNVFWFTWKMNFISLESSEIKIRPRISQ